MPDFTAEQRTAAVLETVTARFNSTVKEPFLDKGMTVRALRFALEPKRRGAAVDPALARLAPARFDEGAGSAAKLELVQGKVMYSAVAAAADDSAAVLRNERDELRLGYLVVAQVSAEGELLDPEIRRVDELRAPLGRSSARASSK